MPLQYNVPKKICKMFLRVVYVYIIFISCKPWEFVVQWRDQNPHEREGPWKLSKSSPVKTGSELVDDCSGIWGVNSENCPLPKFCTGLCSSISGGSICTWNRWKQTCSWTHWTMAHPTISHTSSRTLVRPGSVTLVKNHGWRPQYTSISAVTRML